MDRSVLEKKALAELKEIASALELTGYTRMKKADLVDLIIGAADDQAPSNGNGDRDRSGSDTDRSDDAGNDQSGDDDGNRSDDRGGGGRNQQRRRGNRGNGQKDDLADAEVREGVLDLLPEGYGFLRTTGYLSGARDVYVSQSYVRRFHLRRGDRVRGPIRSNNRGTDKFPALARIDAIEGLTLDEHMDQRRSDFRDLTPQYPEERIRLETDDTPVALRIVDLLAPIGKGQRGLVVSSPKAGRTTLLKQLAHAVEANDPDAELLVLLVDERPEEVTEVERSTDGEVVSTTFDRPAEDHTQVAELVIERAKRLVERGRDVVVLVDSLTRLTRAYNLASSGSGRSLPGGLDAGALYPPKRFFGAARNIEDGGSLTIIATALADTGSGLDDAILEEFAGTANMEVRLDRRPEQEDVFPALDVHQSGTRRDELQLDESQLEAVRSLRGTLAGMEPDEALAWLVERLAASPTNAELLESLDA